MAIINKHINDLQTGDSTAYRHVMLTVPANETWAITNILVCNTRDPNDANPLDYTCTFDLHFVPSDGSYSDDITTVVRRLDLPAGETFTFDTERVILDAGDQLVVNGSETTGATEGTLACTVSYMKVL
jgi:hypothetical protein